MNDTSAQLDNAAARPHEKRNVWPIFISYRRSDATRKIALALKKELEASTIEATTGQLFGLDVFVDVAEAHQSNFQANLVPHLQHSRALIVLADDGAALRKSDGSVDYLYSELDWWASERKKTPPIILQIDAKSGLRLVADPHLVAWRNVSFMDCFWEKWGKEGGVGEAEKQQLLGWLRESIRNYGLVVHLEEVRRLKRRALIAGVFAMLTAVAACVAWWQKGVAVENQKIATTRAGELTIANDRITTSLTDAYYNSALAHHNRSEVDRAVVNYAAALDLTPAHERARTGLYSALANQWTPQLVQRIKFDEPQIGVVAQPHGTLVASWSAQKVELRDTDDLTRLGLVWKYAKSVRSVSFNSKGDRLLVVISNGWNPVSELSVYDTSTGNLLAHREWPGAASSARSVQNDQLILLSHVHGPLLLSPDLKDSPIALARDLVADNHREVNVATVLAMDASERYCFWAGGSLGHTTCYLWDAKTWKLLGKQLLKVPVTHAAFSADGSQVTMAIAPELFGIGQSRFSFVVVLESATAKPIHRLKRPDLVSALATSPVGERVTVASRDKTQFVWEKDPDNGMEFADPEAYITALEYSPDGQYLAVGDSAGQIILQKDPTISMQRSTHKVGQGNAVTGIAFLQQSPRFVTVGAAGELCDWTYAHTDSRQITIETGKPRMKQFWELPSSKPLLLVQSEDRFEVWDFTSEKQISEFLMGAVDNVHVAALALDGEHVWIREENALSLWNAVNGKQQASPLVTTEPITFVRRGSTPDKVLLGHGNKVSLVGLQGESLVVEKTLDLGGNRSICAESDPSHSGLVICASDQRVVLWDSATGKILHELLCDGKAPSNNRTVGEDGSPTKPIMIIDIEADWASGVLLVRYGWNGIDVTRPSYEAEVKDDSGLGLLLDGFDLLRTSDLSHVRQPYWADNISSIVMSKAGKQVGVNIAKDNADGEVLLFSYDRPNAVPARHKLSFPPWRISFSPDGAIAAIWGNTNDLTILRTGVKGGVISNILEDSAIAFGQFVNDSVLFVMDSIGDGSLVDCITGLKIGSQTAYGTRFERGALLHGGDFFAKLSEPGVVTVSRIAANGYTDEQIRLLGSTAADLLGGRLSGKSQIEKTLSQIASKVNADPTVAWFCTSPSERSAFSGSIGSNSDIVLNRSLEIPNSFPVEVRYYALNAAAELCPGSPELFAKMAECLIDGKRIPHAAEFALLFARRSVDLSKGDSTYRKRADEVARAVATASSASR